MSTIACIFCYAQVMSDKDQEEMQLKYDSHLMGWHNIADKEERKLAIIRTMEKQSNESKEVGTILTRNLSDKIEKALKNAPSAENQQFTFENEDYVVRSIAIEDLEPYQEEMASNPDATILDRDGSNDVEEIFSDRENEFLEKVNFEGGEIAEDHCQISVETPIEENDLDVNIFKDVNSVVTNIELDTAQTLPKKQVIADEDPKSDESQGPVVTLSEDVDEKNGEVIKNCSVMVTKLKKNVVKQMVHPDISVPWYEWWHHVCVECGNVVFLGSMERHLSLHNMSLEEYQKQHNVPENALSIPSYECLVCGVAVAHTNKKIMAHLQLHNIDMGSYYLQYVQGEGGHIKHEEVENVEKNYQEEHFLHLANKTNSRLIISRQLFQKNKNKSEPLFSSAPSRNEATPALCSSRKSPTFVPLPALTCPGSSTSTPAIKRRRTTTSTETGGELPWYDSSWHQCLECSKVTTRGRFFTSHVKGEHKMTKKEYLEKYPADKVDNFPDWTCVICSKDLCWTVRAIAYHLSKVHSMSKEQYACMYIDNMQDVEDCGEEEATVCDNTEIVEEGEPQTQRLDSAQEVTVVFDKYCGKNVC